MPDEVGGESVGFRVSGFGFRVSGVGCRVLPDKVGGESKQFCNVLFSLLVAARRGNVTAFLGTGFRV